MTAVVAGQRVPDAAAVLRRASVRLNQDAGDVVLTDGQLADLTSAVQQQIVEPLLGEATAGPGPEVAAELEQLRAKLADYKRSVSMSSEQYRKHTEQIRALSTERDQLQAKLDGSETVGNAWAEALAATAEQRAALWELVKAAVRERRQARQHAAEVEQALDERSSMDDQRHKHYYPAEQPGDIPGDCECGHPYPRAHITDRSHETADEPDAWARFFAGLRDELADWQPERKTR